MRKFILLLLILNSIYFENSFSQNSFSQNASASFILNVIYKKSLLANDYSANAHIKVDLPFLKMLPINATIYFKQKDKFKIDSKSIAILPRQSFDQLSRMLENPSTYSSMIQSQELIGNIQTTLISVIPLSDTSDLILGKLWIDTDKKLVLKSQLTTKNSGTILTEYFYGSNSEYGLPDQLIFTVDIKKFKIPKSVSIDINNSASNKVVKEKTGKIFITLSNYRINKGIEDGMFK